MRSANSLKTQRSVIATVGESHAATRFDISVVSFGCESSHSTRWECNLPLWSGYVCWQTAEIELMQSAPGVIWSGCRLPSDVMITRPETNLDGSC
jgi:hypothetical protein